MSIGRTLGGVWAELNIRMLTDAEVLAKSNGAVLRPETINYRTFRPESGGLFDVDIFGDRDELKELLAAGMDVDWGRSQMTSGFGHVELAQPIVHPYFATHGLAELADACGWESSQVRSVLGQEVVVLDGELVSLKDAPDPERVQYGAAAIAGALSNPDDFIVQQFLVSPIATRPMVDLSDGRFATSNVTDLYRRLINRSNRLRRLLELNAPAIINMNEQRMLQEAAVSLCFNGFEESKTITGPERVPLVPLYEIAQRDAERVKQALGGAGPARGVRAMRAFEAIGFEIGESAARPKKPAGDSKVNVSLAGAPVPIPDSD